MEDLDSLLEDLGRGKSSSTVKNKRPPSSRVDLNELENLMEDLAAPTSRPTPTATPAMSSTTTTNTTVRTSLSPNPVTKPVATPTTQPSPTTSTATFTSTTTTTSTPTKQAPAANMDDLDALMESLNASSRGSRRSQVTSPVNSPTPRTSATTTVNTQIEVTPPVNTNTNRSSVSYTNKTPSSPPPPVVHQPTTMSPSMNNTSKKSDDLDALLNNLTSQMNTIDTENPASRGTCGTCKGAILGEVISALGKSYHPEHFTCGNCKTPLGTRNFYEQNGAPHCEPCYQDMFCPKCAHCDQAVLDRCITALGKKWHVDHFICTDCLKPFQGGNFFERDGRPYCEADYYGRYAPKCGSCNEPIRGDCINALGSQWHPEHFACTYCQKSFQGGSFFEFGGKPYCETHYHQQTGSLCSGCGKPISGKCVNALDKKWHPEHFVCAFCMNPLAGASFTEHNSKAYCKECHGKLFGNS